MASPEITLAVYFSVIAAVSLVYNFLTIHPLANLVKYEGVKRSKSLSISFEFALLTATFYTCALGVAMMQGIDVNLSLDMAFGALMTAVIGGSGLLVEIIRIWYVREVFETNLLYSFIIAETVNLTLLMLVTVLSYTVLPLI